MPASGSGVGTAIWGGVLVGGASRRMGEPKQLLRFRGVTLVERAVAALTAHMAGVALLGDGAVPEALAGLPRVADVELPVARGGRGPGAGPLAGMLAALRWKPQAAWIFAPCDLPEIGPEAVAWLLAQRRPERWAVVPRPEPDGPVHAVFALYEPPARRLLEDLAAGGRRAPRRVAGDPRVAVVAPPAGLARAWRGVNARADLAAFERG
jgi:molybdopterin-guanine dinucleotide biosynthesis protein A